MKELTEIINKLHSINEQVVEKDNLIDQTQILIQLTTQLINDADFIRSEIYLDLRVKYIAQIDAVLKKITQNNVTIEPENVKFVSKTDKDSQIKIKSVKHFTKDDISAPIRTDIYTAPSCRRTFTKKKAKAISDDSKVKDEKKENYLSFDYKGRIYYLSTEENNHTYDVYNDKLSIVGKLEDSKVTIITDDTSLQTETINLRTAAQANKDLLFGSYFLN